MAETISITGGFPPAVTSYPPVEGGLLATLQARVEAEPFNAFATAIFVLAILHTFSAARFAAWSHRVQHRHEARLLARGEAARPSLAAEALHFLGEVEVVFGLWALPLLVALVLRKGWGVATHYLNDTVNYTEPVFVVVIMALASTRPVIDFAESALRRVASLGGGTPRAWWLAILTLGPLLGSVITEPAAMTICALLLARQFYDLAPSRRLRYATLGLLFVNVSIGGTLTHFAAPPILVVARTWEWSTPYLFSHFGGRATLAIAISVALYALLFRKELAELSRRPAQADIVDPDPDATVGSLLPVPAWLTLAHLLFLGWCVFTSHYPALFLGGFLFFLGFAKATSAYQSRMELRTPLLVGFFLAGLVIHGGLQGWWIAPILGSLSEGALFRGAGLLTAFTDNALITYLATLVPGFGEEMRIAVVQGAVVGGGLTVIANAPNPAGQAILGRYFDGAVLPIGLLAGALLPTLVAALVFRLI
jgi:hypothetical protein